MTSLSGSRIAIVSRIFSPEPAAASLRLEALATGLRREGAEVVVFTTTPPGQIRPADHDGYEVRRLPALRDRDGYVRGYLNYLSFDVPAFFRILFARRFDALIVEPPPTTGISMRAASWLRRTPYIFYGADIWSEAAAVAGTARPVVAVVELFERIVYRGAKVVLAVSASVASRIRKSFPEAAVSVVGNGYDETVFHPTGARVERAPYLLYAGTASEVHGARVFVEAIAIARESVPDAELVFIGHGSDWQHLKTDAERLPAGAVTFLPRMPPEETATWIRGAHATLASIRSGGYDAFPTKMYASVGCGTQVIFSGDGEGTEFARTPGVGWAVDDDPESVAAAMVTALTIDRTESDRAELADWARRHHSLASVGTRITEILRAVLR